jgi:hypothetical protein
LILESEAEDNGKRRSGDLHLREHILDGGHAGFRRPVDDSEARILAQPGLPPGHHVRREDVDVGVHQAGALRAAVPAILRQRR